MKTRWVMCEGRQYEGEKMKGGKEGQGEETGQGERVREKGGEIG